MIAFGILLIIIALALGIGGVWATSSSLDRVDFALGPLVLAATPIVVFIAGMATILLLGLGLAMVRSGTKHSVKARRERRDLRHEQRDRERELEATQARLASERERNARFADQSGNTAGDQRHDQRDLDPRQRDGRGPDGRGVDGRDPGDGGAGNDRNRSRW